MSEGERRVGGDPGSTEGFKEFRPTSFAVDHPTTIMVLALIVVLMGIVSYRQIPRESFPEIVIPNILVNTVAPGFAPRDMESLVTRPLEEKLNAISDVKEIRSRSVEGFSSITVEFATDIDMTEATQLVREKVDLAKPDLPDVAEDPQLVEINFSEFPIMQVNVAGDYGLVRLREVAQDLEDDLKELPGVLDVKLAGGLEREVQVAVDLSRLKFYGLSFDAVIEAIRRENVTVPGGSIDVGGMKYLTRVPGEYTTPEPIRDIVVTVRDGRPVYVRDVATVEFGFKERDSFARLNGSPVVSLAVSKRSGENLIATADLVRATIDRAGADFPPGTTVTITADQSKQIHRMVSSLENNIISGLLLVMGVLVFFLGIRTSWFVGLAIPMSMLLSFIVIRFAGFSLNMVVLFSLILALGMLVDNAIVVVENIYRFRERGWDRRQAAKYATGEVALPVIASTATTLAAFFPMAFWSGLVGEFMVYLPLTLIITLSSSLFVGLIIVPTLCSLFLATENAPATPPTTAARRVMWGGLAAAALLGLVTGWLTTVLLGLTVAVLLVVHSRVIHPLGHRFMTRGLPWILARYRRLLDWSLDHRLKLLGAVTGFVVAVFVLFGVFSPGVEYFPEDIPPERLYVQIEAPVGTAIDVTNSIAHQVEGILDTLPGREDFESVVATVGSKLTANSSGAATNGTHLATVTVNFVDYQDRRADAFQTLERIREAVGTSIAGADVSVEKPNNGPSSGPPINIEVAGPDPDTLRLLGSRLVSLLERSPVYRQLDGLESDMAQSQPELVIDVDRERAALQGLSTLAVGRTVRSAINGTEASTYRDGEDEYDITVRLARRYRDDIEALGDLTVTGRAGTHVPLSSVASWRVGRGFAGVNRVDLDRVVTVSADVRSGYNANATLAAVKQAVTGFAGDLPRGYRLRYTGQQQDQQESQAFLVGAFVLALVLIALILVSQFDSVLTPLIILSAVILSTVGVLIGLMVLRIPFGIIMTGIGVISLAGIVVNNAIVLIDYIGILRRRDGMDRRRSLIEGGITRFRPVILTAVTTILGLVPLAIGLNFDFEGLYTRLQPELYWGGIQAAWWGPMAIAVIAGLAFATFLTLVLVPVMISLADDVQDLLDEHFRHHSAPAPARTGHIRSAEGAGQESAETGAGPGTLPGKVAAVSAEN